VKCYTALSTLAWKCKVGYCKALTENGRFEEAKPLLDEMQEAAKTEQAPDWLLAAIADLTRMYETKSC
jgi:thioredoxin-like negative regulator of GroEL